MRIYTFDQLIGNQHCISILKTCITQGTLPHFTIFHGIGGTGKSTCAEITALAMTCQHTMNGSPCLECTSCKSNLDAIKSGTKSSTVAKINLGRENTKTDVDRMIKEIFTLQSSERNCVYILEEAHALSTALQTSLLEEIDRLDSKTYIILCTTKLNDLIPELRSRAVLFQFKRLTDKESRLLLDKYLQDNRISMEEEAKLAILNYTKGIPREIVTSTEFLSRNTKTLEELLDHIQQINDTVYFELFQVLATGTIYDLNCYLKEEVDKYDIRNFINGLKEFYINMFFQIEGNVDTLAQTSNVMEFTSVSEILKKVDRFSLGNLINKLPSNAKRVDLSFFLINLYQYFHNKKTSDIVREKKQSVITQKSIAAVSANEVEKSSEGLSSLHAFSTGNTKYKFGGGNKN
ncbi:AAA family ATPase [Anaerobutyricum hallii]|uniref:AAA family ATPase n=1 Tax=Anaerobutyricum hallii TaxID=39488 RepID=UPI00351FBFEC